jgi:SAM-dependent methyltransferase
VTSQTGTNPGVTSLTGTKRRPFRSAVPFYVQGRLDYPSELLADVAASLHLEARARVLDLGCGPGFLALGYAGLGFETIAMDPEPEMLAAARRAADAAKLAITFIAGSSEDLSASLGRFGLVVMGRSFHWMDRERTLAALDGLIEPSGGIAIFRDGHPKAENAWRQGWRDVHRRYAPQSMAGGSARVDPETRHDAVLLGSAFSTLERLRHRYRRRTSLARLIDRALSMSSCSPEALGDRRAAFEADLREALAPYVQDGVIEETVEAEALLARRPG